MTTIIALPPLFGDFVGGGIFDCWNGGVVVRWNLWPCNPRKGKTCGPWLGAPAGSRVMQLPISATVMPGDVLPTPLPGSLDIAAKQVNDLISSTTDDILLVGYSKGAQGISRFLDKYADQLDAATAARIRIVVWGNPLRKYGGYAVGRREFGGHVGTAMRTDTSIEITDIAMQYDGFADSPLLPGDAAAKNADQDRWGINFGRAIHAWSYRTADPNNPGRREYREGNTLFVLLPHSPLVGSSAAIEPSYHRPEH